MAQYPGQNYPWGEPTQRVNPIWGNLLSMIPTVGPILGGIANQVISQIGINKQNQYNSPMSQVDRLRKAGLPMASMTPAGAGNQSTVPQAHLGGGIAEGSKNIGLYAQTQQTKEAIKLLNEQIRLQKAEADIKSGERDYKLGQAGTDIAGTNQSESLIAEQNLKNADVAARELTNKFTQGEIENQKTKQGLENENTRTQIAKSLKDMNLVDEKITTEQLEQDLKRIEKEWNPKMNEAQKQEILARTGLINEQTTGARLQNIITEIDGRILQETSGNIVTQSDLDTALKGIVNARTWDEFTKSKAYNAMVAEAQKLFTDPTINPIELHKRLSGLFYTTLTQLTGAAGNIIGILGK